MHLASCITCSVHFRSSFHIPIPTYPFYRPSLLILQLLPSAIPYHAFPLCHRHILKHCIALGRAQKPAPVGECRLNVDLKTTTLDKTTFYVYPTIWIDLFKRLDKDGWLKKIGKVGIWGNRFTSSFSIPCMTSSIFFPINLAVG